ncbi:MAG: restriction endonuclease subunit S [Muribaculaceae bacterium]|nr:restriction endonuclease subunit S [Muribaculaceae bacterium]
MKDSGIPWIGEIPKDWEIKPLKYVLNRRNEKNNPIKSKERLSLSIDIGITKYEDKTTNLDRFKDDFEQYQLAYPNDIVLNSMNMIVGAVGKSNYFGCVSPVYYVMTPSKESYPDYYGYLLNVPSIRKIYHKLGKGIYAIERGEGRVNTCRLKVSFNDFGRINIPFPPIQEQKTIAEFLDRKCSEIDELVALQDKMIEELKAYKQSIITETVTKGLNPNLPLKNSGIEWIGEIPQHWDVKPFKAVYSLGKGLTITKADLVENGISVISYGQIHSKSNSGTSIKDELIRYVPSIFIENNQNCLVNHGDVIFADTSEDLEGCGNCIFIDRDMLLFAGYHTIIAFNKSNYKNKYFSYLFKTDSWRTQLRTLVNGVKLYSIPQKTLSSTYIIVPPLSEQQEIADYLDNKCSEIDSLIELKQQKIEELKDYKKSIIYEYVTGKKQVEINEI